MKPVMLSALRRHAQGHRYGSAVLAKLAHVYLSSYFNHDHDPKRNGEYNLLRRLRGCDLKIFFDVGANRGEWSDCVISNFPHADVHAFEIIPGICELMGSRADSRLTINAYGLSDANGHCPALVYEGDDCLSTTVVEEQDEIHKLILSMVDVEIARGDTYCSNLNIGCIDFLKIDVEGAEHKVMVGFGDLIAKGKVKIIQFEYGMANIYTKFLLRDYYNLLGQNYVIGRLCPNGVHFKDYDPREENFRSPNFVAVERSQQALLDRMRVA